jgi:WD40 repeat protein
VQIYHPGLFQITNDNYFLISASDDVTHVWNVEQRTYDTLNTQANSNEASVTAVAMSRDQKYSTCGTRSGVVALWDLDVCQCIWTVVQNRHSAISALHFCADSIRLLSGNATGLVHVRDLANGRLLREFDVWVFVYSITYTYLICRCTSQLLSTFKRCQTIVELYRSIATMCYKYGHWCKTMKLKVVIMRLRPVLHVVAYAVPFDCVQTIAI